MENAKKSIGTPLGIISLFFSISEIIIIYGITKLNGPLQYLLAVFVFIIVVGVGVGFFYILINKPLNFYPPSEYGTNVKPQDYAAALNPNQNGNVFNKVSNSSEDQNLIDKVSIDQLINDELENTQGLEFIQAEITESTEATENLSSPNNYLITVGGLIAQNKYQEAREVILSELPKITNNAEKDWQTGRAAFILSHYDFGESINEFDRLIIDSPVNNILYYWYSEIFSRTLQFNKAINVLDMGLSKISNEGNREFLIIQKIVLLIKNKEYGFAEEVSKELIKSSAIPRSVSNGYRSLGEIYRNIDKKTESHQSMINAYKADPTDLYNLSSIANFFSTEKEIVLELFFRLEAVKISETEQTLGLLGNCYLNNNKNNLAMVCYRKANELSNSKAAWIIGNIGNLYNNLGLYDLAVEYINEAKNLDPTSQYLQDRLSSAFTNQMEEKNEIENLLNSLNLQF